MIATGIRKIYRKHDIHLSTFSVTMKSDTLKGHPHSHAVQFKSVRWPV